MNKRDISADVLTTLGEHVDSFDVDGIVEEIGTTYGYDITSINDIPNSEYFRIAKRHSKTD